MAVKPERAREIMDTLGVIEVFYRGAPVWIEKVDGDLVEVQHLENRERIQVPVMELSEDGGVLQ